VATLMHTDAFFDVEGWVGYQWNEEEGSMCTDASFDVERLVGYQPMQME
jgi:hypothetical protein